MKILWFCPYPVSNLFPTPVRNNKFKGEHPATWIVNLLEATKLEYPTIKLHVATINPWVNHSFSICKNGVIYHVCKSGIKLPFGKNWPTFKHLIQTEFKVHRRALIRVADEVNPDLIHAHGTEAAYALAALDTKIPVVISLQGLMHKLSEAFPGDPYFRMRIPMERKVLERGHHIICKTPFAREFMEERFPGKKMYDLENPMNEAFFEVPQKEKMGKRLLFVGAVVKAKGIEELLQVMDRQPEWSLSIVGHVNDAYQDQLRSRFQSLGNVNWAGTLSSVQIAVLMERHDALVLPSYMDTSPNVVSEAMCASMPVVATRVGGIPNMVSDGETGFLVESQNVDALDEGLVALFSDPARALEMGRKGREEAKKRFAPKIAARKVIRIYQRILESESEC